MATITFSSASVLTSATTVTVSTSYYTNSVIAGASLDITNTKTSVTKSYNPIPQLDISVVGSKSKAFVSGSPIGSPNFTDGVLNMHLYYEDGDATDWQSDSYVLVTTAIDAAIAVYPQTTFFQRANLIAIQYFRQQIDIAFAAQNYTLTNTLITTCQFYLTATQGGSTTSSSSVITKTDNSLLFLNVVSNPTSSVPNVSQYNEVLNTLSGSPIAFANTSLIPSGIGSMYISSTEIYNEAYFADGVYQAKNYYTSPFYLNNDDYAIALLTGYYVITTTITNQFATFEANYDPNNADQAASYQTMLTAFAQIDTLSSNLSANYAAINTQIQLIQNELALFVDLGLTLELTSPNTLKTTITSTIPNVTYSDQSLVLTNVGTNVEYTLDTFPANYVDTTKNITSTTFDNSTTYADSVYEVQVSWSSANNMEFAGTAYALVTTAIDCGIAKYGANNVIRKCNSASLRKATELLMFRKFITLEYAQGNYEMCIEYIKRIQTMLANCGCNC